MGSTPTFGTKAQNASKLGAVEAVAVDAARLELRHGRVDRVVSGGDAAGEITYGEADRVELSSITLDGQPLGAAATYRVTINAFLADGGDGFTVFKQAVDRLGGGIDLAALEAYLTARSPVAVPALGRSRSRSVARSIRTPAPIGHTL